MKKLLILVIGLCVLLSMPAYSQYNAKHKIYKQQLNDAQRFEQQMLQKRNQAKRIKKKKRLSGTVRRSNAAVVKEVSEDVAVTSSGSSAPSSSGGGIYKSSVGSVSSGMFIK